MLLMDKKRIHFIFSGDVQGVGFRWRASQAARMYGLTGWVENNYDGTVEMELQGTPDEINAVLDIISSGRFIDITDMRKTTVPLEDDRGFSIR